MYQLINRQPEFDPRVVGTEAHFDKRKGYQHKDAFRGRLAEFFKANPFWRCPVCDKLNIGRDPHCGSFEVHDKIYRPFYSQFYIYPGTEEFERSVPDTWKRYLRNLVAQQPVQSHLGIPDLLSEWSSSGASTPARSVSPSPRPAEDKPSGIWPSLPPGGFQMRHFDLMEQPGFGPAPKNRLNQGKRGNRPRPPRTLAEARARDRARKQKRATPSNANSTMESTMESAMKKWGLRPY